MKKKLFSNKNISLLFLVLASWSCSSDLNFDQVNDVKIDPVVTANLTYFDLQAHEFVNGGVEAPFLITDFDFDVFNDPFLYDHLVRADLFFEMTNTIDRRYLIDVVFLNNSNEALYYISFDMLASTGSPQVVKKTEVFKDLDLNLLKQTKRLGFRLAMLPGNLLTENSLGSLKLKSSATIYMEIE